MAGGVVSGFAQSLDGKVAWVTGAGRGTGRAVAEGLAASGARVILHARTAAEVHDVADKLTAAGAEAEAVVGSVTDRASIDAVIDLAHRRWGQLDVLVNNAGISPVMRRSEDLSDEEWASVIDTNLTGLFQCTRAAGRVMIAQGRGSVVNISSVHGSVGYPRLAAYSASKGGVEVLTKTLALEWAPHGVRVNAVAPGYLKTQMTAGLRASDRHADAIESRIPMGRFGLPSEVVDAVMFLCSEAASYVTGSILRVDGGWTAQ
jgi:NAD(P)-dependent dehydrogenase (short-subunit alcohol dehydrogenase family)